ncbi:putative hydrolase, exported protein [Bradyrhizobium sp. STM 3843]|uniref:alpha/beta hydrolase family protein n=1 Tax=Bradyrhizobium sp. STM 3843 TaxID=551947 RepID=UPI0002403D77|nr:dienelactone hydrolase family protein [Bradyrhizobium sp. STM 3843]CCE10942.1 putative hydrolase, exported protein [Bradyrhizobium sp. STM 3843]
MGAILLHRTFGALALTLICLASPARTAGLQLLESDPKLHGIIWTPCATAPASVPLGSLAVPGLETLPGVKDCPIKGTKLPLVIISHGRGGWVGGHHDVAEALADAGFIVAGINHPGDTVDDSSQRDSLSVWLSRPQDIERLIDFMLNDWKDKAAVDPDRIGFFGFSRGGYTGTVLVGVDPDFDRVAQYCTQPGPYCDQIRKGDVPKTWPHDNRIKAAVFADAAHTVGFTKANLAAIKIPLQVWRSELGGNGVDPEGTARVTAGLPGHPEIHVVPAAHFAFLAPCSAELAAAVPRICADAPPDFDRAAFHREFDAEVVRFFSEHLTGK